MLKRVKFTFSDDQLKSFRCQVKSAPKPSIPTKKMKGAVLPYQRVNILFDRVHHKMRIEDIVAKYGSNLSASTVLSFAD